MWGKRASWCFTGRTARDASCHMMPLGWGRGPGRRTRMDEKEPKPGETETVETASKPVLRRGAAGKRKAAFKLPPPAAPVKGLLLNASLEEQQTAHRLATTVLATWLGQKTRGEAAKELGLPVVRVKQLSEAALSGMVAGLLKQPTRMPKGALPPEEDPVKLRKRIGDLEEETQMLKELVNLLKDLPANKALAQEPAREPRRRDPKVRGVTGSEKPRGEP